MLPNLLKGFEALGAPGIGEYLAHWGRRAHPVKDQLVHQTHKLFPKQAQMQTHPIQAELLALLVQATSAKRCIEVGVFTGLSALCIALALPAEGRLDAFDVSKEFTDVAREHWKLAEVERKIRLHLGPAVPALERLLQSGESASYDFAYIDADKENGALYHDLCVKLVRKGGMVLIDNALWGGSIVDPNSTRPGRADVIRQNEMVHKDHRVNTCLLPLGDGLLVSVKK